MYAVGIDICKKCESDDLDFEVISNINIDTLFVN